MKPVEEALACPRCIISVMGAHAGEGVDSIFTRKIADIDRVGKTFWLARSPKAQPAQVQKMCQAVPAYVVFIAPATKGGARPTVEQDPAKEFSQDLKMWRPFPNGLGPVTGKLDSRSVALVFDMLTLAADTTLDLWNYADFTDTHKPVKLMLGCSTSCAVRRHMSSHPDRLKSRYRDVVAVARLSAPFCVWVR
jgi:hypothetical protein